MYNRNNCFISPQVNSKFSKTFCKQIYLYVFYALSSLVLFSKVNYHNFGINTSLVTRLFYTKSMRQKKCDLNHQPMPTDSAVQCSAWISYTTASSCFEIFDLFEDIWYFLLLSDYYWHRTGNPLAHYLTSKTLHKFIYLWVTSLDSTKLLFVALQGKKNWFGHSSNNKYLFGKHYQIYTLLLSFQTCHFNGILVDFWRHFN